MKTTRSFLIGLVLLFAFAPGHGAQRDDDKKDARLAWWRDARFGMFVHWGVYAVAAGEYKGQRSKEIGEWIMSWANIPRAECAQPSTGKAA